MEVFYDVQRISSICKLCYCQFGHKYIISDLKGMMIWMPDIFDVRQLYV
jgi:hypothetical protein